VLPLLALLAVVIPAAAAPNTTRCTDDPPRAAGDAVVARWTPRRRLKALIPIRFVPPGNVAIRLQSCAVGGPDRRRVTASRNFADDMRR